MRHGPSALDPENDRIPARYRHLNPLRTLAPQALPLDRRPVHPGRDDLRVPRGIDEPQVAPSLALVKAGHDGAVARLDMRRDSGPVQGKRPPALRPRLPGLAVTEVPGRDMGADEERPPAPM